MTLEKFDDNYTDFESRLIWLLDRMRSFHTEARKQAKVAEKLWSQYVYSNAARMPGIKDRYDEAVELQKMYDRWTIREAAVIQAEVASRIYRKNQYVGAVIDRISQTEYSDTPS